MGKFIHEGSSHITSHQSDVRSPVGCSHRCHFPWCQVSPGQVPTVIVPSEAQRSWQDEVADWLWESPGLMLMKFKVSLTKVTFCAKGFILSVKKPLYQNLGLDHFWWCFRNFWSKPISIPISIPQEIGGVLWQVFPLLQGSSPGCPLQESQPLSWCESDSQWWWQSLEMFGASLKKDRNVYNLPLF